MKFMKPILTATLIMVALTSGVQAATFAIDAGHSSVSFKVKHMMVSNVRGEFTEFEGSFEFDSEAPKQASATVVIQMASVDTNDEKRDAHLRNADFFDVENNPTMTFESTKLESEGDGEYVLHGKLTLNGVTKNVKLDVEFNGVVLDPWGNTRAGFEAEGEIDRKDFGITWSKSMDGGGVVVGDKVEIEIEIEGVLQK